MQKIAIEKCNCNLQEIAAIYCKKYERTKNCKLQHFIAEKYERKKLQISLANCIFPSFLKFSIKLQKV
jgi:hypothetical protein